jgi:hypothetical protein
MRRLNRPTLVGALGVGVLAAAGTAVALDAASSDPSLYRAPVTASAQSASADSPAFRRAASANDTPPANIKSNLQYSFGQFGPNVDQARRTTASNGDAAYLVPATGGLCAASANDTLCGTQAQIASGSAVTVDLCSPGLPKGQIEVQWLLPEAASGVSLGMTDGSHFSVRSSSLYIERFVAGGNLPKSIEWDLNGKHYVVSSDVPPDAQTSDCVHPGDLPPPSSLPKPPGSIVNAP